MNTRHQRFDRRPLIAGVIVGMLGMLLTVGLASAAPLPQDPTPPAPSQPCNTCHVDVADRWSSSPHAHAFDDPTFQDWWQGHGQPGECLSCHTTGYQASTGQYLLQGVGCEACHGPAVEGHPPAVVSIKADTEYCGSCHTTTLAEWRVTGHALEGVGCMDCHDPHSQEALFEVTDDLCINCHKEGMDDYLNDTHVQKGIGCVDCHALVIPPETPPDDGIVPTGHQFTITPRTCVACHTDALHAGFALPGYENGAKAGNGESATAEATPAPEVVPVAETTLSPEQQIQALESALASQSLTTILQGGVIGLVLGASTAWLVANNVRRGRVEGDDDHPQS